jgi:hypothetical protein
MMVSAVERGVEGWSGPVGIPAGDQSVPPRDSAWSSLDLYGRVISSGREDRHRLEASPRRRCAGYAAYGIAVTMPLPGLCRKLTSQRLFMGFSALAARHSVLPCLALWESDKPALHFFKYD